MGTFISRFDLDRYFNLGKTLAAGEQEADPAIIEELMLMLLTIVNERVKLGLSDKECIELEIITRLSIRDHTHSQLSDTICRRWFEHDNFEEILRNVSEYHPPHADKMEQGKYKLQARLWDTHWDPYHLLIRIATRKEYQAAIEAYQRHSKAQGRHGDVYLPPRTIKSAKLSLATLARPLSSKLFHGMVYFVLKRTCEDLQSGMITLSDMTVRLTLCLLHTALLAAGQTQEQPAATDSSASEQWMKAAWGFSFCSNDIRVNIVQEFDSEAADRSPTSILYFVWTMQLAFEDKEVKEYVQSILNLVRDLGVKIPGSLAIQLTPPSAETTASPSQAPASPPVSSEDDAKRLVRERQAALLATFAQQRQQFVASSSPKADEADEDDLDDNAEECLECAICKQLSPSTDANPMGMVCLVQKSRVLGTSHAQSRMPITGHTDRTLSGSAPAASQSLSARDGMHMQTCGHYVHLQCFMSYFRTLHRPHRLLEHDGHVRPEREEFGCPMCRRLANVLVPILPNAHDTSSTMETDSGPASLHAWLAHDVNAAITETTAISDLKYEPLYEPLIKFGACSLANQVLTDASLAPGLQLWSLIGWNVALLELECRSKDRALGVSRTQKALLQRLIHTARMLADVDPQTRALCHLSSRTLLGHVTEHSEAREALLTLDPFTALVHTLAAWPLEVSKQFVFALVEKLVAVCLLQALLVRARAVPNLEPAATLSEEDALAPILFRLQAVVTHACSAGVAKFQSTTPNFSRALLEQQPEAKVIPADLTMYTITSMLVFLRRSALLLSVLELQPSRVQLEGLFLQPTALVPATKLAQDSVEFETLRELLHLPELTAICNRCLDEDGQLTWDWLRDLSLAAHALEKSDQASFSLIPPVSAPIELHLISVPELYHDLFKMYRESRCLQCEQIPDQPTLCLICGALVCSMNSPCPENCIQVHAAPRHA